jgi:hypothetical protein
MTSQNVQKQGVASKEAILNVWRHRMLKQRGVASKEAILNLWRHNEC